MPELRGFDLQALRDFLAGLSCDGRLNLAGRKHLRIVVNEFLLDYAASALAAFIRNICLHFDSRLIRADSRVSDKDAASGNLIGKNGIGNVQRVKRFKLDAPIQTAKIDKVKIPLRFSRRDLGVIGVIQAQRNYVLAVEMNGL